MTSPQIVLSVHRCGFSQSDKIKTPKNSRTKMYWSAEDRSDGDFTGNNKTEARTMHQIGAAQ